MKKIITLCTALFLSTGIFAQAPEKMSYQAVIRDGSNNLVASSTVGMRISILQGSSSGTAVYVETHTPTTNANGLASLEIGGGTVISGSFTAINWGNGPYFIQTETDPAGGTAYSITGTSQLLSVPYALYSSNGTPGINFVSDTSVISPSSGVLPQYDGVNYTTVLSFTAPSNGTYWTSLHTETYDMVNMVNPVMSLCAIYVNGSLMGQPSQNITQHNIGRTLTLSAGDVVELRCASNLGGGYALNSHGYIMKIQ